MRGVGMRVRGMRVRDVSVRECEGMCIYLLSVSLSAVRWYVLSGVITPNECSRDPPSSMMPLEWEWRMGMENGNGKWGWRMGMEHMHRTF